ncbi:MAG: glycoside hydrolase family 55 protein [Candidatus Pacebacteria bacterium]|nr:glycoside hydrolase family 55 protein [Candidatus Paceibacterota bacterium]
MFNSKGIVILLTAMLVPLAGRPAEPQPPHPAPPSGFIAQPSASHALHPDQPYVTPEMYGAVGNDISTDDTEAIQRLFSEKHGKLILFPGKDYHISETITIPKRIGCHVMGAGFHSGGKIRRGHGLMGNLSRLVWIGSSDAPMVVYHGSGLIWNGVELCGRPPEQETAKKAKIGFLVAKSGKGIGTGKMWFPALSINNCETGFQAGTHERMHNCDNLIFGYLALSNCTYGFRTRNHMAMDIHFSFVKAGGTMDTLFYFERGGAMHVNGLGLHSANIGTMLRIGWVGRNNGFFSLNNVKIDAVARNLKLIDMEQPCPAVITVTNLKRSWNDPRPTDFSRAYTLKGPAVLAIRDSRHIVGAQCFVTSPDAEGNVPNVLLDHCDLPAELDSEDLHHPDSSGKWYFKTRDCYAETGPNGWHRPLD